jgi:general secretion pathway protein G
MIRSYRGHKLNRGGFTLIELMIVISIIVILTGIGIREYFRMSQDARIKRAKSDIKTISEAVKNFNRSEKRQFYKVRNLRSLAGKYLEKVPVDPWGSNYHADGTFIICFGEDKKASFDDIKIKYEQKVL